MKTIELNKQLKVIDCSIDIEPKQISVYYDGQYIANISRDDENFASIYLHDYEEPVITDERTRKKFLDIMHEYITTPLDERDNDNSKVIDMKISYEKLGLIVDLMENAFYSDELHINDVLLKPLYFSLLDLWGKNVGIGKGDTDESNN